MHRVVLAVLLVLAATPAGAQMIQAGPVGIDLTGRLQTQFNTTSVSFEGAGPAIPATAFEIRRARMGANLVYADWIRGTVEVDFAGGAARLTDGYVDVPLAEAVVVRAGQFKKPFSRIELTSSTRTLTIERGLRIRGLSALLGPLSEEQLLLNAAGYVGRDVGVMVHGVLGRAGFAAGVFNGSGANAPAARETKALAARGTFRPVPVVELGLGVSRQPSGILPPGEDEAVGTAWGVDAEYGAFRRPGLRVMAEAMAGDLPVAAPDWEPQRMWGIQAAAGWFAPRPGRVEGIEPVARISVAGRDTDAGTGVLLTPGLNLYFTGRNRLMVNGDIYKQSGDDPEYALVAQLQIHF